MENLKRKKKNKHKKRNKTGKTVIVGNSDHTEVKNVNESIEEQSDDDQQTKITTEYNSSVAEGKPKIKKKKKNVPAAEDSNITEDQSDDDQQTNNMATEYSDDDSDAEEKPKRKKKKKSVLAEDTSGGKGKKSKRQLKKEKYAQRQADAIAVTKDALKQECLSYLSQWKHARDQWKFMKIKQGWLFKNKFSSKMLPDESWPILLEYFESARGNIKTMLLEDANNIIKQMDACLEKGVQDKDSDAEEEKEDEPTKPDDISYKRARDIIQHLQE